MHVVTWAIDPYEFKARPNRASVDALFEWCRVTGADLQPVYVSGPMPEPGHPLPLTRHVAAPAHSLRKWLKSYSVPALREPRVILSQSMSVEHRVDAMLGEALNDGASWIAISTKERPGLSSWMTGSFAETLIHRSPLPVWALGHGPASDRDPCRVLFATDLSEGTRVAFEHLVPEVKAMGGSIVLFHAVPTISGTEPQWGLYGSAAWLPLQHLAEERLRTASDRLIALSAIALARGVPARHLVEPVAHGRVSHLILDVAARVKAGTLAFATRSGPLGITSLGGHGRQIVRHSESTVWVFGPACLLMEAHEHEVEARTG